LIGLPLTFLDFTAVCVISLIIAITLLPETRGVSLERIEADILAGRKLRFIALSGQPT
jgi:SP family galactose:H+ symporter-like MFS transporter